MNSFIKPLVLCADDYAEHAGITQAVLDLARQGRLSATSVMVLSPRWQADAAPLRELRDRIDVGLHLDWTSAFARDAGHGLGLGAAMRRALLGGFRPTLAAQVIERQLDAFEATWQAPPDHVDGHQHVHQFAGIRDALVEVLARRYGSGRPWLRVSRVPAGQRDAKSRLIAWMGAHALQRRAERARLPCAPALSGVYDFGGGGPAYARRMAGWLGTSPAGTVLMCHPAHGDVHVEDHDPISAARSWEFRHLRSAAFEAQCEAAGVRLVRGSTLYRAPA